MADWGQGLKGAGGGALAGAGLGGPLGAVIGGGLGLLGGLFGGESENDSQRRQMLMDLYNRQGQAPQAGPASQAGYSGFRENQSALVKRLEALSQGQGPSLAAQQFQQATDRNNAQQMSMAVSGRGGPLAGFNAANNMGVLGAQAAQGSAIARTQEEQMALQQLGLTLHSGREADESMNRFNSGQQNQFALANLDARLKSMGMDDARRLQILQMLGGQNSQPGLGDQLLAGGAGLYSLAASQGGKGGPTANGGFGFGSIGGSSGPGPMGGVLGTGGASGSGPGSDTWLKNGGF